MREMTWEGIGKWCQSKVGMCKIARSLHSSARQVEEKLSRHLLLGHTGCTPVSTSRAAEV